MSNRQRLCCVCGFSLIGAPATVDVCSHTCRVEKQIVKNHESYKPFFKHNAVKMSRRNRMYRYCESAETRHQRYYRENKEKVQEKERLWKLRIGPETWKEFCRRWHKTSQNRRLQYCAEYKTEVSERWRQRYAENPDLYRERTRKYGAAHREELNARSREKRRAKKESMPIEEWRAMKRKEYEKYHDKIRARERNRDRERNRILYAFRQLNLV